MGQVEVRKAQATADGMSPATARRATRRLAGLRVHYISLVGSAANGRQFLAKAAREGEAVVEKEIRIAKADETRHIVYGIVYAPEEVDSQGDTMTSAEIEKAAYGFMQAGRTSMIDTDHSFEEGAGYVAESWLLRANDPLFPDEAEGAWAVGIKVTDDTVWGRVEKGELTGLSLAGLARAEQLAPELDSESVAKAFVRKVKQMLGVDDSEPAEKVATEEKASGGSPAAAQTKEGTAEPVQKSFRERLLRSQLWQITSALSDAVREVLEDDTVKDKVAAVRVVVDEFSAWLEEQVQTSLEKGTGTQEEGPEKKEAPVVDFSSIETRLDQIAKAVAPVVAQIDGLTGRLERLEQQTPGRQTILGEDDEQPVKKAKPYKGLALPI